jgi:hypothetical protein
MATVLQFTENLTDRQAAEAVRDWITWKYALGLALDDPGFDATVLSDRKARLGRNASGRWQPPTCRRNTPRRAVAQPAGSPHRPFGRSQRIRRLHDSLTWFADLV